MLAKDDISCRIVNARFVKPMDIKILTETFNKFDKVLTVCENALNGGFGDAVLEWVAENNLDGKFVKSLGIPDRFIEHGPREALLSGIKLDAEGIAMTALELHQLAKARTGSRKSN
jgi:1-deoxy-D-xylulose-5-phosphate synthase